VFLDSLVCSTNALPSVELFEALASLLVRSAKSRCAEGDHSGFPFDLQEGPEAPEIFNWLRWLLYRIRDLIPEFAHMATVLVAILYLRRAEPIHGLCNHRSNMLQAARQLLIGTLMLATMVRAPLRLMKPAERSAVD
jgi:hypothetical protein